eukprot:14508049-Alexandrium_andersonii.AAC.1
MSDEETEIRFSDGQAWRGRFFAPCNATTAQLPVAGGWKERMRGGPQGGFMAMLFQTADALVNHFKPG